MPVTIHPVTYRCNRQNMAYVVQIDKLALILETLRGYLLYVC